MDYIKIRFTKDFDQMGSKFEKTFEDLFRSINPMITFTERRWRPQMDIYETPDEIIIMGEIAGVSKEDLELEISSKAVRIQGIRTQSPRIDNATYRLAEIQPARKFRIAVTREHLPTPFGPELSETRRAR